MCFSSVYVCTHGRCRKRFDIVVVSYSAFHKELSQQCIVRNLNIGFISYICATIVSLLEISFNELTLFMKRMVFHFTRYLKKPT